MNKRKVKLEILTFDGDMYSLVVDGVVYAQSRNEVYLSNLAFKVKQLNEDIIFNVIG